MDTKNEILDSIMGCPTCGYYTCKPRDFARHQTTKKHLMKIDAEMKKKEDEVEDVPIPELETEQETELIQSNKKPRRRRNKKNSNKELTNISTSDELYDWNNQHIQEAASNLNDYNNEPLTLFKVIVFLFNFLMNLLFEEQPSAIY